MRRYLLGLVIGAAGLINGCKDIEYPKKDPIPQSKFLDGKVLAESPFNSTSQSRDYSIDLWVSNDNIYTLGVIGYSTELNALSLAIKPNETRIRIKLDPVCTPGGWRDRKLNRVDTIFFDDISVLD